MICSLFMRSLGKLFKFENVYLGMYGILNEKYDLYFTQICTLKEIVGERKNELKYFL